MLSVGRRGGLHFNDSEQAAYVNEQVGVDRHISFWPQQKNRAMR
jgi:hypothetical protein